jgi:hypothetical protein
MAGESDRVEVGGHEWRLVRAPGKRAKAEDVTPYVPSPRTEPRPEPDLDPDKPLADASRRLHALPSPPPRRPLVEVGPRQPSASVVEVLVTATEPGLAKCLGCGARVPDTADELAKHLRAARGGLCARRDLGWLR